ncbi:beta-phosphoglucomutase [Salipaludibacillus sp. CUR1]|uniref:beta-phosphoglucomutase n=1 Tax=Salipaludibacillus sp. CUR1 TaxID=2820003 RepID=UPI001E5097D6|nr:beta-phosphoglucomutase [Salipaludibacillus sp. CUR1]MCE7791916.1 beta-phosphoglucomutase [Salipaludibacillus sp. CUR1]
MKAVIFDLDGVLADTVEFHYLSIKKVAEREGVPFTRQMNQQLQGMNRKHIMKEILKPSSKSYSDNEIDQLADLKNKYYIDYIQTLAPGDALPGMVDFLKELKSEKIRTAIASSSSNARTVLENLGITGYFDIIINAKDITRMKPDPEIFLKAADELEADYRECAAIEDSEAGLKAIKATPMFSVGIGEEPFLKHADLYLKKTEEISLGRLYAAFINSMKRN